jgi:hypothetical protein
MTVAGFEPVIPASEWPQTHALDRAATGIGINVILCALNCIFIYYHLISTQQGHRWGRGVGEWCGICGQQIKGAAK